MLSIITMHDPVVGMTTTSSLFRLACDPGRSSPSLPDVSDVEDGVDSEAGCSVFV